MDGNVVKGGTPYAIDIKRLNEAFPVPDMPEGRQIPHEVLEATIAETRGTGRYYGVINTWIRQMRASNGIYMIWEQGKGIVVLDNAQVHGHAEGRVQSKTRQFLRARKLFNWVDRNRLDPVGQARYDHVLRVTGAMEAALKEGQRELAVPLSPIQSLPRPRLLKKA